jgi:hypothetical protein
VRKVTCFSGKQGDKVNILEEIEQLIIEQAMPGAIRNIKQTSSKVAHFIIKNYSQVNKND